MLDTGCSIMVGGGSKVWGGRQKISGLRLKAKGQDAHGEERIARRAGMGLKAWGAG